MPTSPGIAFVVVSRLDPTRESLTPELLGTSTTLHIEAARDGQPLLHDHVYVVPPHRSLTIENGCLRVQPATDRRASHGTIDRFFRSLASDQGSHATAIMLSGMGTEGRLGVRAVKAKGGLVIAQAPETAAHPAMPASAIPTGLVDLVLEPERMPEALVTHVRNGKAHQPDARRAADQESTIRRLEELLLVAKEREQSLIAQLEASHGHLHSATRDVRTLVERLRASNQVLATATEKQEAIKDEVTAIHGELQEKVHQLTVVNDELAELLVSTDLATVVFDRELRVTRATEAASRVFNLKPGETGQHLQRIASTLVGVNLVASARAVLDSATPIEREVATTDRRDYLLRVLPSLADSRALQGVVMTLVDVSSLKRTERELRAEREQTSVDLRRMTSLHETSVRLGGAGNLQEALQDILRTALEITGAEMGYIQRFDDADVLALSPQIGFSEPFLDFFTRAGGDAECASRAARSTRQRVAIEDLAESDVFAGSPSLPVLLNAGVRAMQATPLFDRSGTFLGTLSTHYRALHQFDDAERRWLDLLARPAGDVIHRWQTDATRSLANDALEQRVADRTKWLALMHQVTRAINDAATWHEGLRLTVERLCKSEHWQAGYVYLPDRADSETLVPSIGYLRDQSLQAFHRAAQQCRFRRGEGVPGRVYEDGRPRWVNGREDVLRQLVSRREAAERAGVQALVALPIRSGQGVIAVLELCSNQPHAPNELLVNLMNDIGAQIGKVLERERSTADMADLVWREQQGLLHTLHDSLGQTLTGLGMLATGLKRQAPAATVERATQIGQLAQQAIAQVRQLAKGLFPLEIDAQGLVPALRELAVTTETFHSLRVTIESSETSPLGDSRVATQLYRIAQEAVTNAVKHAIADSIRIELRSERGVMRLQIVDDGAGITGRASKSGGLGLRIMMYRAVSIGATLTIEPGATSGTTVTCTLRLAASAPGSATESSSPGQ